MTNQFNIKEKLSMKSKVLLVLKSEYYAFESDYSLLGELIEDRISIIYEKGGKFCQICL